MATPTLTTEAEFREWGRGSIRDASTDAVSRALVASEVLVEDLTGRSFLKASYSISLNGDDADGRFGDTLRIPARYRPVLSSPTITVAERGVALTVATGYTTTADVILVGLDDEGTQARIIRRPTALPYQLDTSYRVDRGTWFPGVQNILVGFDAGFELASMDQRVRQAVYTIAITLLDDPKRTGTFGGASVQGATTRTPGTLGPGALPPRALELIDSLRL